MLTLFLSDTFAVQYLGSFRAMVGWKTGTRTPDKCLQRDGASGYVWWSLAAGSILERGHRNNTSLQILDQLAEGGFFGGHPCCGSGQSFLSAG
jgi:hypothetical protein